MKNEKKINEKKKHILCFDGVRWLHTQGLPVGWVGVQVCARERDRAGGDVTLGL